MLKLIFIMTMTIEINSYSIESVLTRYFESDVVGELQSLWTEVKKPLEDAIASVLKDNYGERGMNVFVRKIRDPHFIAKGFYHNDDQVHLLLTNLDLEYLPYVRTPEVEFLLPDNILRINASLSKITIQCRYTMFRNKPALIYEDKKSNQTFPFNSQLVEKTGYLAMSIEGCILSGFIITMLTGPTVNLGLSSLELINCRFSLELIHKQHLPKRSPSVTANYELSNDGLSIQNLLLVSLQDELMPKLQAAMFGYCNTTMLLGDSLSDIRKEQERIFRITWLYLDKVVANLNKLTVQENLGSVHMEDFNITSSNTNEKIYCSKMILSGLETVYLSHSGGPYFSTHTEIREQFRLSSLHVNGQIAFDGKEIGNVDFSVVMKDVNVDVTIDIPAAGVMVDEIGPNKCVQNVMVTGWRSTVLSTPKSRFPLTEALIIGHMYNTIPSYVVSHFVNLIDKAMYYADKDNNIQNSLGDNSI